MTFETDSDVPAPKKKIDQPKVVEVPVPTAPRPSTPATPPKIPGRNFVDQNVTPEFLLGLYDGNTILRAETLISEQQGKWMLVSGPLGEIHSSIIAGSRGQALVVFSSQKKPEIYMWFSGEWTDRLANLPKNQNISVIGQLKKVVRYAERIELENCELVDRDPTANDPTPSPNSSMRPRRRRSTKK